MKNFSTAASLTLCVFVLLTSTTSAAREGMPANTVNQVDAKLDTKVDTAADTKPTATRCEFRTDAPDQHLVVKGDTLWDISLKFLHSPWCWPQVWGMNRDQIRDPHWIYPGQIVYFDRANGRLGLSKPAAAPVENNNEQAATVRLSPQIRMQAIAKQPIAAIRWERISAFLIHPLVIQEGALRTAPVIMATEEGRVNLAHGDHAYVRGELDGVTLFDVFRPGLPLKDPETGAILGYEAGYLGQLQLDRLARKSDEAHRMTVTQSQLEMGVHDRLQAVGTQALMDFFPHAPLQKIDARIMSIYGAASQAGTDQVVTINRGSMQGVDPGTVLELHRRGVTVRDATDGNKAMSLPDHVVGRLFVFRVFEKLSYGLIMQVNDAVKLGDVARSPE